MKLHGNARTCLHSRSLLVRRVLEEGWTLTAAEAAGVSVRTVSKWLARFRADPVPDDQLQKGEQRKGSRHLAERPTNLAIQILR